MGRGIARKNIEDGAQLSEDQFDDKVLERIEKEFDQLSPVGGQSFSQDIRGGDDGPGEDTEESFSLDDLEAFPRSDFPSAFKEEEASAGEGTPSEDGDLEREDDPPNPAGRFVKIKVPWLWVAVSVVVCSVGIAWATWWSGVRQVPPSVPMVRRPIEVPRYPCRARFLLPIRVGEKMDILSLEMELEFVGSKSYRQFESSQVVVRDKIYRYLLHEHPEILSHSHWQETVEKKLLSHLRENLPATGIGAIRLLQMDVF